jgi:hypothetical protein
VSGAPLSSGEEEEMYVFLKAREDELPGPLEGVLRRIERSLFERLTVAEMERLVERSLSER